MDVRSIELPLGAALRLQSRSARVHVIAEDRTDVQAETDNVEWFTDAQAGLLSVRSSRGGSKPLTVRCPLDTDVSVGTQSGAVKLEGTFGSVSVTTMSGDIDVDTAEDADLRSMAGKLSIRTCHGRCRMQAVSGTLTAGDLDNVAAGTISGSIKFGRVMGDIRAKTVSGSIEFASLGDGNIAVKTVSGKVHIALPPGTEPQTLFKTRGHVTCQFPQGRDCRIEAASLSGSIEVVPQ
ncbi:MAG TPA: DUF4097 family beta strand repeat-containing protein [Dehalococcoidia bacterium]